MTDIDADFLEAACIAAHNAYEAAAHEAGWATNTQSRKPWSEVPEANKIAMRAGIGAALAMNTRAVTVARADALREAAELLDKKHRGNLPEWIMSEDGNAVRALIDKGETLTSNPVDARPDAAPDGYIILGNHADGGEKLDRQSFQKLADYINEHSEHLRGKLDECDARSSHDKGETE